MNSITVFCTDVEQKALLYQMADIQEWLQIFVTSRANRAIDDLVAEETQRMLQDPSIETLPANREKIVMNCTKPFPIKISTGSSNVAVI